MTPAIIALMMWIGFATSNVPECRANDGNQLGRLDQHQQVALFHQETGDDCRKDNDDSNDWQHLVFPGFGYAVAAGILAGLHGLACALQ